MFRHILSTTAGQIGCHCRHYARNRFSRPTEAADPKKFVKNIRAINKIPSSPKSRSAEEIDDPDDISQYESDFGNLDSTHKSHKKELIEERERIKHQTVQTKYFRTNQLNFLTWAEKEQIRYLHDRDAEEWCIEKLAESFPADCETIAKIVKARWTPKNDTKIYKHDESVRRAWLSFEKNQVGDIDPELREHLQKFSGRTVKGNSVDGKAVSTQVVRNEIKDDFSKILTSCQKYQRPTVTAEKDASLQSDSYFLPRPTKSDTFVLGKVSGSKPVMFRELDIPDNSVTPMKSSNTVHNPFVDPRQRDIDTEDSAGAPHQEEMVDLQVMPKYEMTDVQSTESDMRQLSMPAIRDEITIPKHLWKRGATYKLADCFYDDDGEFLYRVPGMTGRK